VWVCGHEMVAHDGRKQLWGRDGVLFRKDVAGLFLRVGGYDNGVVGFSVTEYPELDLNFLEGVCGVWAREAYEVSISPSRRMHTVISTTDWIPVFSSRCTLYSRMLSLP
jgi:hypothetical protein